MSRAAFQRALNILKAPLRSYNEVAQRYPFETGVVTTVVKTSAADLFAQKVIEGRDQVDWKRHSVFVTFGFFYLGGFQYYLYNHLFVKWCAGMTAALGHKGSAPIKTFIDQAIHHPFFYFPVFYGLKGYVEGRSPTAIYEKYRAELWDNCKALWTIWVPAQLVNFSVVPRHLRIPFVAGVSFAWTVVISVMRGALEGMQQSAPTTAQLEDAVAQVAAAAAAADAAATAAVTALAEPLPASATVAAASPIEPFTRSVAAAAPAHVSSGPAQAARAGLKALVPRPHVAAADAAG